MKNLPILNYYSEGELCVNFTKRSWYLIPYEIITKPQNLQSHLKIIKGCRGIYVYSRSFPSYLDLLTDYNEERFYRRFYNSDLTSKEYKCPICGKPYKFISVGRGYVSTCGSGHEVLLAWKSGVYKNYDTEAFNSVKGKAKSARNRFISRGNPSDICAFYISFYKELNFYKYGVTNDFIESRERSYNHNQKYFHILLTATRVEVAEIEYQLKLKFNRRDEYFELEKFNEFKNYFKNIIESSNIKNTNQWKDFLYGG